MTAKQRQRWERWHRAGKARYLCRNSLGGGLLFCAVYGALSLLFGEALDWPHTLLKGAAFAFINLIVADSLWKQNEAKYAQSDQTDR